jgi:AraC-like DNA-binding protein
MGVGGRHPESSEPEMGKQIHQVEQHKSNVQGIELMTLLTNHHFPRHSHDQFAIGAMTSGAIRSWSGIGRVQATAGDMLMANPGEIHDGIPLDGNIYFDPDIVRQEIEEEIVGGVEIARPVVRDPLLVRIFTHLFECLTNPKLDRLATEENLLRCLIYLLRRHGTARPSSPGASPCVMKAKQRMDSAPERSFSLAELAELTGVSRFQLLRGFAREIGITPHAYLVQRRVCLARRLLAAGQTPAQAAIQTGFADQSHLTRAFVRQLGITPARYRAAVA